MVIDSQMVYEKLGTLKPGQTKKITHTVYIYTDAEVQKMYGPGATVDNPFPVGGFTLYYKDYNGLKHTACFETHWIKLV